MADFLIFIDTNILLDFYRVRGRESGLLILKHIDENLPRFITSSQVEMEFKKHRQRVILESLGLFKPPDWGGLQLPAFISESKQSKALTKNQNQVKKDGLREEGLAICCGSCNSSRGRKTLLKWFQTGYCLAGRGETLHGLLAARHDSC